MKKVYALLNLFYFLIGEVSGISHITKGFIENKGQLSSNVLFYAELEGQNILIFKNGFAYDNEQKENKGEKHHRVEYHFTYANQNNVIIPQKLLNGISNFYINSKEILNVKTFESIIVKDVYLGVDIKYTIHNDKFKYDFIINPGGNINSIRVNVNGAKLKFKKDRLSFRTSLGVFEECIPVSYIRENSQKVKVNYCKVGEQTFGFNADKFPKGKTLIIDPVPLISWSTYMGGTSTENIFRIETDELGYVYICGISSSTGGISTSGSFQSSKSSGIDGFISKFDSSGQRLWSTYFGGSGDDYIRDISYDGKGGIYFSGHSTSSGLATSGVHQTSNNGAIDAIIGKFNTSGARIWCSYFGGSSGDEAYGVKSDSFGNVFAVGRTSSSGLASSGAYLTSYQGGEDGFLIRMNSVGNLIWSTYMGGNGQDYTQDIQLFDQRFVVVNGFTFSSGMGSSGVHQTSYGGAGDIFIARLSYTGSFSWLTYYGGSNLDLVHNSASDNSSVVYFGGYSSSTTGIATSGVHQTSLSGGIDAILIGIDTLGKRVWGTYTGGSGSDEAYELRYQNKFIYLAGRTTSSSGIATSDALNLSYAGGTDVFLMKFDYQGTRIWGTYFGGTGDDVLVGAAIHGKSLYLGGSTTSSSKISTSGAHQSSLAGNTDCFLTKFENLGCGYMTVTAKILSYPKCPGDSNAVAVVKISGNIGSVARYWKTNPPIYNDTAANLPAGVYQVVYEDSAGCKDSINVYITEPIKLRAVVKDSSHMSCAGTADGYLVAGYFGGSGPYNVKWNTSPVQSGDTARNLSKGTYKFVVTDINQCKDSATATILEPDTLKITISGYRNASCFLLNDGYISVSVKGGWVPYKYLWNTSPPQTGNTAYNLTAGYYEATVTDNKGCVGKIGYTITEPTPLTIGIVNREDAKCYGDTTGQISSLIWGGTPGYSYSWNTTPPTYDLNINHLKRGTYVLTARDANNCTTVKSVVINEPDPLKIDFDSIQNVVCNGDKSGSVKANFSGGTAPYSYSWNTAPITTDAYLKNVPAGTYVFHLIDTNACYLRDTITLKQQDSILTTANISDVTCAGLSNGSIRLQVKGGTPPFKYKWSHDSTLNFPDAFDLKAGRYNLTLTDVYSCTQNYTFDVREPDTLKIRLNLTKHIRCFDQNDGAISISLSGGTPPYDLQWNTNPPSQKLSLDSLKAGKYNASVTDQNGCADSLLVILTEPSPLTGAFDSLASPNCFQSPTGYVSYKAQGGVRPYKYSFNFNVESNDSFNAAVKAGMIQLKLTDANGCVLYDSVQLIDQKPLSISADVRNVKCFDTKTGSILINAQGGVLPYEYSWSPTFTDTNYIDHLDIGIYSLTLKDRFGCLLKDSFLISQPTKLTAKKELEVPVSCFGRNNGIAAGSASGGMPEYRWFWNSTQRPSSSQLNDLYAGKHVLYVMDSFNCIDSLVFNITEPARIKALASQSRKPTCVGWSDGRALATPIPGVGPYSYKWSDGQTVQEATGLAKGNYTVIIKDACGDTAIATVTIEDPEPFIIPNILGVDRTRSGHSQTYEMKYDSSWKYEWKISGGEILSGAGTHQVKVRWTHPNQGILSVTVTNGQGCTDDVSMVINLFVRCLEVYPNPSQYLTHVFSAYADGTSELEAFDARGRKIMTWPSALDYNIDVSHWADGIYFFRYKDCVIKFLKD